MILFEVLLFF